MPFFTKKKFIDKLKNITLKNLKLGDKFNTLNEQVQTKIKKTIEKIGNDGQKLQDKLTDGVHNGIKNINTGVAENYNKATTGIRNGVDTLTDGAISGVTDLKDITKFGVYNIPKNIFRDLKMISHSQSNSNISIFENKFKSLGKTLDEYMKEIAFDQNTKSGVIDNEHIVVRNEILSVFHKSKLNPEQLATLLITNNIYIENEKPGDWTRLQTQEVEEEMYNMRNEPGYIDKDKEDEYRDPIEYNRDPKEQSFTFTKKIKQTFD